MAEGMISSIESGVHRAAWGIALRGLAAVIFGIIALKYPSAAAGSFVVVFAVFAFADALFEIVAATALGRSGMRWGWYAFSALVNVAAGVVALTYPQVTFMVLLLLVAVRAIVIGGIEIALAVSWRDLEPRWLLGLSGALSIVFGVLLFANPARGGLALLWTIGVYAIAFGVVMIVLGARLAMGERQHALPGGRAAAA